MPRYIDADKIPRHGKRGGECYWQEIEQLQTVDVVEIGKPYFYEEGYVLKDFHNGGVHRYFVIERTEE